MRRTRRRVSRLLCVAALLLLAACGGEAGRSSSSFGGKDVAAWTGLLGSADEEVRDGACAELAVGGEAAVEVLCSVVALPLGGEDTARQHARAHYWAVQVLAQIGSPAVPALIESLGAEGVWARSNAADALQGMHPVPVEAKNALVANLGHEEALVRVSAARALASPAMAEAAPALVRLLEDEDRAARESAAAALREIGAPAADVAHDALVKALADDVEDVRSAAVQALEAVGPRATALEPLLGLIERNDLAAMYAPGAIAALGTGAAPAVARLAKRLAHEDWSARGGAAEILGAIGAPAKSAVDPLLRALTDRVMQVRWAAAEALGRIGDARSEVTDALRKLAEDDDEERVRTAATEALERLGS